MGTWNATNELEHAALGKEIAWYRFKKRERKVRRDFWTNLKRAKSYRSSADACHANSSDVARRIR
jgi:ribosomal protein RSM22 (predicted rRNA methylase)